MRQSVFNVAVPAALTAAGALASSAMAGVTITNPASAPAPYSMTLNFDEPGGPTGDVTGNEWTDICITSLVSGSGAQAVANLSGNPGFGWLPNNNVFYAPFGAYLNFSQPLTAFACQYWDSSGPATFTGGGAAVIALSGGEEVGSVFLDNPAFGGVGNSWFNIVAAPGMTFDEVRLVGFGFFPEAYVDNISFNKIPTPGASALFALGGVALMRRRRA